MKTEDFLDVTRRYETWMATFFPVNHAHLQAKHEHMASNLFLFDRATYYRWQQLWKRICKDLSKKTKTLSGGDIHIGNYGLWSDTEGRVNWGINDVDEAYPLSWANDPVRLANSVQLANEDGHLKVSLSQACDAILTGFERGLVKGTKPFVLASKHRKLHRLAFSDLRDPRVYWDKMNNQPIVSDVPADVRKVLLRALPAGSEDVTFHTRQAGEGSLGRPRYMALATLHGDFVARECKALLPSASAWDSGKKNTDVCYYQAILQQAARCPDPFLHVDGRWIVRRIGPNSSRIELFQLAAADDEWTLLKSMGREIVNLDLADAEKRQQVLKEFGRMPSNWLYKASQDMAEMLVKDFERWGKYFGAQQESRSKKAPK